MPTPAITSSFLRIPESIYTYRDSSHIFSLNWFISATERGVLVNPKILKLGLGFQSEMRPSYSPV
jgi:hypothetical protein